MRGGKWLWILFIAVIVVALIVLILPNNQPSDEECCDINAPGKSPEREVARFQISLWKGVSTPNYLTINSNQDLVLEVISREKENSTLYLPELGLSVEAGWHTPERINISSLEPGTYHFYADFDEPAHYGTILVVE